MNEIPEVLEAASLLTAVVPLVARNDQLKSVIGPAIGEVAMALKQCEVMPCGALFVLVKSRRDGVLDLEVGFPVPEEIAPSGRVVSSELPAARVARVLYQGGYEGLADAWAELDRWVEAEGLAASEMGWEFYVRGPESSPDPSEWWTELSRMLL